jgi:metal-responsive CopG/Arc/MetJ family transcriptional regulator
MRKELGDEQVRVTVRLPQALYDDLVGSHRLYRYTGTGSISDMVRRAVRHYLACPDLQRAEAETKTALEQGWADHKAKYLPS